MAEPSPPPSAPTVFYFDLTVLFQVLEKSLRTVFDGNLSAVVRYLDLQLSNLDQLPLTDFIFSREYRKHYAESAVIPAKKIAE